MASNINQMHFKYQSSLESILTHGYSRQFCSLTAVISGDVWVTFSVLISCSNYNAVVQDDYLDAILQLLYNGQRSIF